MEAPMEAPMAPPPVMASSDNNNDALGDELLNSIQQELRG